MPMGIGSGCGVNSSIRLPYDRGACRNGARCTAVVSVAGPVVAGSVVSGDTFAFVAVFFKLDEAENRSLGGRDPDRGLARQKYVALKLRHWQRRHIANGWRDGLKRDVLGTFPNIVSA